MSKKWNSGKSKKVQKKWFQFFEIPPQKGGYPKNGHQELFPQEQWQNMSFWIVTKTRHYFQKPVTTFLIKKDQKSVTDYSVVRRKTHSGSAPLGVSKTPRGGGNFSPTHFSEKMMSPKSFFRETHDEIFMSC